MKYVIICVVSAVVVTAAFQNCKQMKPGDGVIATQVPDGASDTVIDLSDKKILQVNFLIQEKQTINRSSGTYDSIVNKTLEINLDNNRINVVSDNEAELADAQSSLCLTDSLKNELESILQSSKVCNESNKTENQICTQVMRLPYAQIITDQSQIDLGAATDGCGSNSYDLCGEQATVLKGYISNLKNIYKTLTCP